MNWMNNWEKNKSDEEDARLNSTETAKAKNEAAHIETLIKEDIVFMLNEIAHGRFDEASKALSICRERYSIVNPEILLKLSDVEDIIKLRENPKGEGDRQLDLPL